MDERANALPHAGGLDTREFQSIRGPDKTHEFPTGMDAHHRRFRQRPLPQRIGNSSGDTTMSQAFLNRIDEQRVAEVLTMIAAPRNRRSQPLEGDLAGDFDFWFDGGACRTHTGSQHYVFANGTHAHVVMPAPWLSVNVTFPDGEIVDIVQRTRTGEANHDLPCVRLDRFEQR